MLSRRLVVSALAATAAASRSRRARAARERTLRIGYLLSTDSQLGAGATAMAEELAKRTQGRIRLQQFPDAALGGEVEMLKAVQLGTVDLAFITGAPLPNILPEAGIFDIPFLFRSPEHAHAVLDSPIGDTYRQRFAAKDLVALAWGENGMRHITNDRHPIAKAGDLQGLKLRLPQSDVMLAGFKALGASVAPLPFPQLYEALRAGTFDGQENPIATILAAKFSQVQKYLTLSGHVYDPALMVMSPDVFDDLSPNDKAAITAAARVGAAASRKVAAEAQHGGVAALQALGMQVTTDIDRPSFTAALAAANLEFERQFGKAEIDRIRRFT
jgi:tripartite ATP-independent transporter DctP family solute receptor